ncbi:MAG: DUF6528 family protein [Verrucomicrobiota bacterium]
MIWLIHAIAIPSLIAETPKIETVLIACGGEYVFLIEPTFGEKDREDWLWSWKAASSEEIDPEAHAWFRSTDDCKPYGDSILITSSSGGVALVDRVYLHCKFYTFAKNAHSACLAPRNRVAVAASFGGDQLMLFQMGKEPRQDKPLAVLPLKGAHGVEWDSEQRRLWALGTDDLLLVEVREEGATVELAIESSWKLPTTGGHDLSPTADGKGFFVTSNTNVYRFEKATGTFSLVPKLANLAKVKSVDQHRETGEIVYHQAEGKNWWSDTIRFKGINEVIRIPGERLYKVRWDLPR